MTNYVFGVDIGGTTIKTGLFDAGGELVEKWEIPTDTSDSGSNIIGDIAASIKRKMTEKGISKDSVGGIGMGVPGPVLESGKVLGCVNLGWGEINAAALLSEATGLKVKSGNDANVAALGEMWRGGGMGYSNMVMVTLGTGVGGGIVLGRKILYGSHGAGGEIGHAVINPNETEQCTCKNRGCLEQYCAAAGIVRTAENILSESDAPSVLRGIKLDPKVIFDAAKAGDAAGLETVEIFADRLGRFLANISAVIDPQIFVIGGGISKAGGILTDSIQKYYKKYAFHASKNTKFSLAVLGNDAGIYGGAMLILN